ncbi:PP2C family protein-serine/threonine phosphatase [Thermaerobacillus caldiproteolyticus]|uniref:Serine phosphatase RsbU (Regulator of sigma subunit) n=1 Tax=Thermaerobacillus caldiproteolyticus TaxID=247480 RepID=A0A7V9Z7A1_9BACL|nr:PP2C family protein-serine/threonine phosphatase [Anoxybacillus caldiproteolyticus]MBA2875233.1 serine phosphatase RsbU (regulator of sigma subunit) [Anoxybacillus caldiproteolyticus]QPA32826.1 serine/threonine-protein phosphatase [Anoxybacillus caldiproteolyticus]
MYLNEYKHVHGLTSSNDHVMEKWLEREINLARNIQTKLLNGSIPSIRDAEIQGISIPARLIGGDYYDFYPLENDKVRIVIGDVMGKGIPAAMLMILTRGAFRSAAESTKGPAETLTAMNKALCQDLRLLKSFVTLFCADWNPITNVLTYASAGHNMPLLVKGKEKKVMELPKALGIMVGAFTDHVYEEKRVELEENDTVFFYTDGIVEAENKDREQFKRERLINTLLQHLDKNVDEIGKHVVEAIHTFTEGVPQKDDITMVILKVNKKSDMTKTNFSFISSKE